MIRRRELYTSNRLYMIIDHTFLVNKEVIKN